MLSAAMTPPDQRPRPRAALFRHSAVGGAALALAIGTAARPAAAAEETSCRYSLIQGSSLTDDCPICGRPTIILPMHGQFDLRKAAENPLFTTYALENIEFIAGSEGGNRFVMTGSGELDVGGEVALTQRLSLTVSIDDGHSPSQGVFEGEPVPVERQWPMVLAESPQTNGTPVRQFTLTLAAAPFRDLWFSTANSLTSGTSQPPFEIYRNSEVLSVFGHRVQSNADLSRSLGIMPVVPDIGLDAFDVLPGGETAFSTTTSQFSESLGPLEPGDVLSDAGRILWRASDLLTVFAPSPPVESPDIDAYHFLGKESAAFSVRESFFSSRLGQTIGPGDLLSSDGTVLRTAKQLLENFAPEDGTSPPIDQIGLDAVFVWPSGEIWFSTQSGFQDKRLGPIRGGDLLSDDGYVVAGNLELVAAFSPLEDLADFGLDGLTVVTDTLPALAAPVVTRFELDATRSLWSLGWAGDGRFFQVLTADHPGGPFAPAAPIQSARQLSGAASPLAHPEAYFKVRQW